MEGMQVTSAFDPMLAKLIAHGKDREEAMHLASRALKDSLILGVTSNIDYLSRILDHPEFRAGNIQTGFISMFEQDLSPPPLDDEQRNLLLAATAMSSKDFINLVFQTPEPYASMKNWRN